MAAQSRKYRLIRLWQGKPTSSEIPWWWPDERSFNRALAQQGDGILALRNVDSDDALGWSPFRPDTHVLKVAPKGTTSPLDAMALEN